MYPFAAIPTALYGRCHQTHDVALVPPTIVAEIGKNSTMLDLVAERLEPLLYVARMFLKLWVILLRPECSS